MATVGVVAHELVEHADVEDGVHLAEAGRPRAVDQHVDGGGRGAGDRHLLLQPARAGARALAALDVDQLGLHQDPGREAPYVPYHAPAAVAEGEKRAVAREPAQQRPVLGQGADGGGGAGSGQGGARSAEVVLLELLVRRRGGHEWRAKEVRPPAQRDLRHARLEPPFGERRQQRTCQQPLLVERRLADRRGGGRVPVEVLEVVPAESLPDAQPLHDGCLAEHLVEVGLRVARAAEPRHARDRLAPPAAQPSEQRGELACECVLLSQPAREGDGQDAVGLRSDDQGRQRSSAADVVDEPAPGGVDRVVVEHGERQLLEVVAERRRPQQRVHRACRVAPLGARDGSEPRGRKPEGGGEAAAGAVGRELRRVEQRRRTGRRSGRVVGRPARGGDLHAARVRVRLEQPLELARERLGRAVGTDADHDEPLEAAADPVVEGDADRHPSGDSGIEVHQPAELRDIELVHVGARPERVDRLRDGILDRAGQELLGDELAPCGDRRRSGHVADGREAIRQPGHARGARRPLRAARRLREARLRLKRLSLGERGARAAGAVARLGRADDPRRTRRAVEVAEALPGGPAVAARARPPDLAPVVAPVGLLARGQRRVVVVDVDLVGVDPHDELGGIAVHGEEARLDPQRQQQHRQAGAVSVEARLRHGELGFGGAPQRLDLLQRRGAPRESPAPSLDGRFERRAVPGGGVEIVRAPRRPLRGAGGLEGGTDLVERRLVGGHRAAQLGEAPEVKCHRQRLPPRRTGRARERPRGPDPAA